jgi:hypothetical protein
MSCRNILPPSLGSKGSQPRYLKKHVVSQALQATQSYNQKTILFIATAIRIMFNIILCSEPHLFIILTSSDSKYIKSVRYNLKDHYCNNKECIVTRCLKGKTAEPKRQSLLGNGSVNTFPWKPSNVTAATVTHTTEELLKAVFSVRSMQRLCKESQLGLWVNSETGSVQSALACNNEL